MTPHPVLALSDAVSGPSPGSDGFHRFDVDAAKWTGLARGAADGRHDFVGLWLDGGRVRMALMDPGAAVRAIASLDAPLGVYPSVGRWHAPAIRLERAMRDLKGADPQGLPDTRPWLDHGAWGAEPPQRGARRTDAGKLYAFLPVEGAGVHQIPVGPVHAGIIEPGHFRFTANGEAVVRLEQRLGYVHKGIEALCQGADIGRAAKLAGRISGDSTVACALAFARAIEAALGWSVPARAHVLRGIMAELERMAHHVNDVGAICNDASVVAIHARCTLERERILQAADKAFGHRLMMDRVVPGGVAADLAAGAASEIRTALAASLAMLDWVMRVYDQSPSLQDRTVTTGIVKAELARRFAAGGYVGRASGRAFDARVAFPYPPYDRIAPRIATRDTGDVDARVWVRVEEFRDSVRLVTAMLDALPSGPVRAEPPPMKAGEGASLIEAFRGDLMLSVRIDGRGRIVHLHARDASWFQWPLLEAAIEGNIVADFPLCNKSFNCSYSGHDL